MELCRTVLFRFVDGFGQMTSKLKMLIAAGILLTTQVTGLSQDMTYPEPALEAAPEMESVEAWSDDTSEAAAMTPPIEETKSKSKTWRGPYGGDTLYRTPAMIGDFFGGTPLDFRADAVLDRLVVIATDLNAPIPLPGGGSRLSISEPGPVGVFDSSLTSVQQLQAILQANGTLPPFTQVGSINTNATLVSALTIAQIQAQLAGTALPFDIIAVRQPQGAYELGVNDIFETRNGLPGTTTYDPNASGALIQGGVDTLNGGEVLDAFYVYDYRIRFNLALADATSGGVGPLKLAEGGSVLPTDRVFMRYSNIHNVSYTSLNEDLNRFVPGFEKTFFNRLASFELRAPFVADATTSYSVTDDSFTNGSNSRFGNLTMYAKALLHQSQRMALTGGLGVVVPTASDIEVNYSDGTPLLRVRNESVHLQPFMGMIYKPNNRFYAQVFAQYDIALSGNSVAMNTSGAGLQDVGTLTDQDHLFFDAAIGYWLYLNNTSRGLTGIIPTVELHQNSSVQDGDTISAGPFQAGNFAGSRSVTGISAGMTLEFNRRTQITAGYATALGGGVDRQYDGSFQLFASHLFGPR